MNAVLPQRMRNPWRLRMLDKTKERRATNNLAPLRHQQAVKTTLIPGKTPERIANPLIVAKCRSTDVQRRSGNGPRPEQISQAIRVFLLRDSKTKSQTCEPVHLAEGSQHDHTIRHAPGQAHLGRQDIRKSLVHHQQTIASA